MKQSHFEFIKKNYSILAVILFGILYFAFFSIAQKSIDSGSRPITEKPKSQDKQENTKEAKVILNIELNGNTRAFSVTLTTNESIGDLFEYLRSKNLIKYESIAYADGTRVSEIDNIVNSTKNTWVLYQIIDSTELELKDFAQTKLVDKGVYKLRYVKL